MNPKWNVVVGPSSPDRALKRYLLEQTDDGRWRLSVVQGGLLFSSLADAHRHLAKKMHEEQAAGLEVVAKDPAKTVTMRPVE